VLNPNPKTRNKTGAVHRSGGGRGLNPNPETLYPEPKKNEGIEEEVSKEEGAEGKPLNPQNPEP